jgi:putative serine protease PepD
MGISVADASKGCVGSGSSGAAPARSGALVCQVFPGTPAAGAGLVGGDVITSVNGQGVSNENELTNVTSGSHPGDQVKVSYVDQAGTKHTTSFALTEWAK